MIIPPQEAYLYYGNWSPEVDEIVLNTVIKLKGGTRWTLPDFPHWFLLTAQQEVRTKLNIHFTEADIKQRMDFMKLRFETFNSALREGASWDVGAGYVRANDNLWTTILQKFPFAGAFYHRDDPHFSKLACLYGLDAVKKEQEVTVVLLSDRTEKISADEPSCYEVNENETEVNSPVVFPPHSVRRKLFPDEDEPPTDRESTNEDGICFIDLDADGKPHTRMMGRGRDLPTQPGRNKDIGGPSNLSSNASSCASNSPKQRWPYIFRKPRV